MLTDRERIVAERYAHGETYKQIAQALFIAPSTVRNHLAAIYRKLDVNSKPALINALADQTGVRPVHIKPESNARSIPVLKLLAVDELPRVAGPSIAVMPFTEIGAGAEQGLFSYGVTENIHTDLTRFRDLFVVGRSSCLAVSRQTNDAREIAQKLGVQYVLQGTIRSSKNTVRITAELLDGETARALWSEQYDRILDDLFTVESELANTITTVLSLNIDDAQYERRKDSPPISLSAYDWQLRGNRSLDLGGEEHLVEAIRCFSRSLEVEPDNATAVAGLSICHGYACWDLLAENYSDSLDLHRALAEKAVAIDDRNSKGHYALSCAHQLCGHLELADLHAARAVDLNPSEYHNICARGYTLLWLDRKDESIVCFQQSLRRNPFAPNSCLLALGILEYVDGNYAQSSLALSRLTSDYIRRYSCLAARGRPKTEVSVRRLPG